MLDKDDITIVRGVIDKKEILKEITLNELNNCLQDGHKFHFRNKYILIENEYSLNKTKGEFKDIMICEGKHAVYYANRQGEVFYKYKNGKTHYLAKHINKQHGYAYVRILRRDYPVKNLIAKHFIKGYEKGDVVSLKNGNPFDCSVENLVVLPKYVWAKDTYAMIGAKTVGLFENGKLVRKWGSARKCAKDLFCSYQTIIDACNNKWESKLFDVRWI